SPSSQAFIPPLQESSALLSSQIARDWQLPDDLCLALQEQVNIAQGKRVSALGQLLYQANIVCEAYAFTPKAKPDELIFLLEDFALPKNLFSRLEEVTRTI